MGSGNAPFFRFEDFMLVRLCAESGRVIKETRINSTSTPDYLIFGENVYILKDSFIPEDEVIYIYFCSIGMRIA